MHIFRRKSITSCSESSSTEFSISQMSISEREEFKFQEEQNNHLIEIYVNESDNHSRGIVSNFIIESIKEPAHKSKKENEQHKNSNFVVYKKTNNNKPEKPTFVGVCG